METLNETQTQNKNATSLWQTIGMYIGMMVGFLYPQIGLGLGMLLGIALGRLVLTKIPVNTPLAQRAQQKSAIILILAFLILFMNQCARSDCSCHCSGYSDTQLYPLFDCHLHTVFVFDVHTVGF